MPWPAARCWCERHDTWFHGEVREEDLCSARNQELKFCETDRKHKRKRRICRACRDRIATEEKLQKLSQLEPEESTKFDSSACGVEMEIEEHETSSPEKKVRCSFENRYSSLGIFMQ